MSHTRLTSTGCCPSCGISAAGHSNIVCADCRNTTIFGKRRCMWHNREESNPGDVIRRVLVRPLKECGLFRPDPVGTLICNCSHNYRSHKPCQLSVSDVISNPKSFDDGGCISCGLDPGRHHRRVCDQLGCTYFVVLSTNRCWRHPEETLAPTPKKKGFFSWITRRSFSKSCDVSLDGSVLQPLLGGDSTLRRRNHS